MVLHHWLYLNNLSRTLPRMPKTVNIKYSSPMSRYLKGANLHV